MNHQSRHILLSIIPALAAILAFSCHAVSAQELVFPERWKKGLTEVPPIYSEDTVTIRILGDIMMHESQIQNAKEGETYDFSSYFSHIQDEIRLADIAIANMEFTLAGEPYSGYPCFSAPDEYAGYLADCGFDVFLAANNHIFDKGTKGAERTIGIYRDMEASRGIRFTGIASDSEELARNYPLFIRVKGIRIALVNATYGTNLGLQTAWPQTNRLSETGKVAKAMAKARSGADIVLALPHWGTEYNLKHSEAQEKTAIRLAEEGADMIIGAHPHVIQDCQMIRIERNGKQEAVPVAYSLGNAVSNMSAADTQLELMATIKIIRKKNGDIVTEPIEFTYLWCSRPGGYNGSYTVLPVLKHIGKKEKWEGVWEYDKMVTTYERVKNITGIKDKQDIANE